MNAIQAFDPLSRQGILRAKSDKQRVEAAWARVMAMGQRFESVRQAQQELIHAVKEAISIEEETGIQW